MHGNDEATGARPYQTNIIGITGRPLVFRPGQANNAAPRVGGGIFSGDERGKPVQFLNRKEPRPGLPDKRLAVFKIELLRQGLVDIAYPPPVVANRNADKKLLDHLQPGAQQGFG